MLKDRLNKDLTLALKAKEKSRVSTLRLLNAAIHNKEIDKRSKNNGKDEPLTDEEVLGVLKNEAKKRKEAIELYDKGLRADLSDKEKAELKIIEGYLPAELSDEELEEIVTQVLGELEASSGPGDFGKVMAGVMKKVGGRAGGERVAKAVKEKLSW